ncbi:SPFH domain-containing protein [uncultured Senegalimassilia sp.]|uniref:SPFH domain-containing protein n=1 Tax=uncultured Senegalimassilia sp. TaxID=1714350 RepID=UPI0026713F50|nr:SPFH domain-containing protein [uncultured Senegalimassilia sp.]
MGLLKAGAGALGGVLADSWRDYFYCDALEADVLVAKGQKRTSSKGRSSNTKGEDNIISDGSIIAVNEGQYMIIVQQGAIVDAVGEAGEYVFDKSTEPSLFFGDATLKDRVLQSFERVGARFAFGGDAANDQRVYFFNAKEIMDNKFGTATPVPFRVVDANIGLDTDLSVRCNGQYSYRIVDPLMFYKNVCGNVDDVYTRDKIDAQLRSELVMALQPAFAKISAMGVRYSAVPAHTMELVDALNDALADKWASTRGIQVVSFAVNSISIPPEDEQMIKDLQKAAVMRDPNMRAANLTAAQADAMRTAAGNTAGAAVGFMGMGMAAGAGGMNAQSIFGQADGGVPQSQYPMAAGGGFATPGAPAGAGAGEWTCSCGATSTGKFCPNCGSPKPESVAAGEWTCSCGAKNTGKFCGNCGQPKPAADGWDCSCGAHNTGAFCSNCGTKRP